MINGLSFIGKELYVFQDNAVLVYDESATSDFDGSLNVVIDKRIEINPISMSESYAKINHFHVTYSSPDTPIKIGIAVDGSVSKIDLEQGNNKHVEKRLPRSAKKNGLLVSFYIAVTAYSFSISDITLFVDRALRKAMFRG